MFSRIRDNNLFALCIMRTATTAIKMVLLLAIHQLLIAYQINVRYKAQLSYFYHVFVATPVTVVKMTFLFFLTLCDIILYL